MTVIAFDGLLGFVRRGRANADNRRLNCLIIITPVIHFDARKDPGNWKK